MSAVKFISVVRDREMYRRCIKDNPFVKGVETIAYDNGKENVPIPVRYNAFLDSLPPDADAWLVFCHEDWMPLCSLGDVLEGLDRNCLYGPVGMRLERGAGIDFISLLGRVEQARKDGSGCKTICGDVVEGPVDTFDCQCLIFHSSLLEGRSLRFDEKLRFDMYVEDFCAGASENFGIPSRTLDIPCRHFSYGKRSRSYKASLSYLQSKYSSCQRRYATIVGHHTPFGGGRLRPALRLRSTTRWIYDILVKNEK